MIRDLEQSKQNGIRKSPILYVTMLVIWTVLTVLLWINFTSVINNIPFFEGKEPSNAVIIISKGLLVFNSIFITYFWLNGVKDFIYVIYYYCNKNKMMKGYEKVIETNVATIDGKVLLVYCTCNDFDGTSLERCMEQNYKNFDTVILDDSRDPSYIKKIDEFAENHKVKVVRRDNNIGFKAGNINNYLMSKECIEKEYQYFVILDSDEIIPSSFIKDALKYFYTYDNVGIVQANHVSTRNRNFFMRTFHIGVNSHWPTYQTMKHYYGFSTMLGHGAMIKRDCYDKVGGFPELVAEDLCLSIEARSKGYYTAFAPNIICEEEYPVDYVAFKKRHSKWTQGNLEFIKNYTGNIFKAKMHWYEKLDIVLFTYNLPLTAIFAFYIFVNIMIAPLLGINVGAIYPLWMMIPTVIFFFAPMLNDVFMWVFRQNIFRSIFYFINVIILYGSMLTTSLISAILGIMGKKAKFIVTPKTSKKMTLLEAIKIQRNEIIFSLLLSIISLIFTHSLLPVLLIASTGIFSIILLFYSNKKYDGEEIKTIDKETKNKSLELNKIYQLSIEFEE